MRSTTGGPAVPVPHVCPQVMQFRTSRMSRGHGPCIGCPPTGLPAVLQAASSSGEAVITSGSVSLCRRCRRSSCRVLAGSRCVARLEEGCVSLSLRVVYSPQLAHQRCQGSTRLRKPTTVMRSPPSKRGRSRACGGEMPVSRAEIDDAVRACDAYDPLVGDPQFGVTHLGDDAWGSIDLVGVARGSVGPWRSLSARTDLARCARSDG